MSCEATRKSNHCLRMAYSTSASRLLQNMLITHQLWDNVNSTLCS